MLHREFPSLEEDAVHKPAAVWALCHMTASSRGSEMNEVWRLLEAAGAGGAGGAEGLWLRTQGTGNASSAQCGLLLSAGSGIPVLNSPSTVSGDVTPCYCTCSVR